MTVTIVAHAKINLTLEALGRREDGYHEVATVMQTVSLADTLCFEEADQLELQCSDPSLQTEDNLVLRAARLLQRETGSDKGALIRLTKRIPAAAGLGSGSTDAAAALVGLSSLWGLGPGRERLAQLAAELGSDVAFFLHGGTALARGRGELVAPLPPLPRRWMVLLSPAIPPVPGKTGRLYSLLTPSHFTSGQFAERLIAHLGEGADLGPSLLYNVFERVAFGFFSGLEDCRSRLLRAGAESVHLAGSGPALFALVRDEAEGEAILSGLRSEGLEACLVETVGPQSRSLGGDSGC